MSKGQPKVSKNDTIVAKSDRKRQYADLNTMSVEAPFWGA